MSSPAADKNRLTAEQKKQNHIESERKRREAIRSGFEKLSQKVPDSEGKASSEGVVLANTVKYIRELQNNKAAMRDEALNTHGINHLEFDQSYREIRQQMRVNKDQEDANATPGADERASGRRPVAGRRASSYDD